MDPIGKSTIPAPFLILGKLAMILSGLFFIVKLYGVAMLYDNPITQTTGVVFFIVGLIFLISGLAFLGKSVSVGLPQEKTELKTKGVYKITRNPIYVGVFLMCLGSCLNFMHILNFIFFGITVGIHHWIILGEEMFLEGRFGDQWREYKKRVPRYLLF
jgi:protein-S-isoprenylcysteine O-methyltransferase Ste14